MTVRPTRNLKTLKTSAARRLQRLRGLLDSAIADAGGRYADSITSFGTVELQNTWVNFVRSYYLSTVIGARLERGLRIGIAHHFPDLNSAVGFAVHTWKPLATPRPNGSWRPRDEPTWHDPQVLLTLGSLIGMSNLVDIQTAFSIGTGVFSYLPVFRNFFAHRNERTMHPAQAIAPIYGIPSTRRPVNILRSQPIGRPNSLIIEWTHDMQVVIELLCW